MLELLCVPLLVIVATVLAWLGLRAWRTKKRFVKWGGTAAALSSVAAILISVISITGLFKLHARCAAVPKLKVTATAEQIRRGKAIADSFCTLVTQAREILLAAATSADTSRCRSDRS